jgi:hypothetical protein
MFETFGLFVQVLTPADETHHINKHNFKVPFVCGCRDLGEALRRIAEGAAMIRTKVSCSPARLVNVTCLWLRAALQAQVNISPARQAPTAPPSYTIRIESPYLTVYLS